MFNVDYDENGLDPVLRLMASDPEGVRSIVWSLLANATGEQNLGIVTDLENADDVDDDDVADRAKFSISADGVLSFSGDNFEDQSTNTGGGDEDVYHVVVQASDGGTTNDAGAPPRGYLAWFKVTVTVMDLEEEGTIALTPGTENTGINVLNTDIVLLQPQVGVQITASLTDPDGPDPVTGITWKWEREEPWVLAVGDDRRCNGNVLYPAGQSGTKDLRFLRKTE